MAGRRRPQGRPSLQAGEVGAKERLVHAARALMRKTPRVDLLRKEVALAAGVAPGLVTYHFPTEQSLVDSVARPIVEQYLTRLADLVNGEMDFSIVLRSVVVLFLEIGRDNGQLLDTYIHFVKSEKNSSPADFLQGAYRHLNELLRRCSPQSLKPAHSALCQSFIWGICKVVSQSKELTAMLVPEILAQEQLIDYQAEAIMKFLLCGIEKTLQEPL